MALFGHRYLDSLYKVDERLSPIVKDLLRTKECVEFNIGRDGEFDEYAASLIKLARHDVGTENSVLTLVLPYPKAKMDDYENYYDEITIPDVCYGKHFKAAITERNRWMVEQADLVIVFVEKDSGGAYQAMRYAKKLNKEIINLYETENYDDFL